MRGCANLILCSFLLAALANAADQPDSSRASIVPVSKDLLDYVRNARQLGLSDNELRQNAIKAGWKPELVDRAIKSASEKSAPAESVRPAESRPERGVADQYVIGAGDVIGVSVWKEPDATVQSLVVRADGKVTLPFIKDINVAGLTLGKAED